MAKSRLYIAALLTQTCLSHAAYALDANTLPDGGNVVSGSAAISQSGAHMDVHQSTDKAIINWQHFDVGRDASVQFHQNNANSVALNRVLTGDASQIQGSLSANGHVYLVNPSGVVFGDSARVDVGGLVASTHNISDADFMAGKRVFTRDGATGEIINKGDITAKDEAVLIGSRVDNQGRITANGGNIALAAGEKVTLNAGADGHLQIAVDGATLDTLVSNGGLLQADGGQIVMTAEAASAAQAAVVANTGTVRAQNVTHDAGRILLLADSEFGEVQVGGTLDASAPVSGDGGFIETSAAHVTHAAGRNITTKSATGNTGTYLIDPQDFTIAASGGDMTGAQLSSDLESNNVTIQSVSGASAGNGDIFVDDAVSWAADTSLTLDAVNDIFINRDITATGTNAGLVLTYGAGRDYYLDHAAVTLSGASATLNIGGQAFTLIHDVTQLQAMTSGGRFALASDIDASATTGWNAGAGYLPKSLGGVKLHGLGHDISDLYINRPGGGAALISSTTSAALIRDTSLLNVDFTGSSESGGFVGVTYSGVSLHDVYVSGTITGSSYGIGGIAGRIYGTGSIRNAYSAATITGGDGVGGIIGDTNASGYTLENVASSGNITGDNFVGGIVGQAETVTATNVYSTGDIHADTQYAAGIFGISGNSTIANAYVSGAVSGSNSRAINAGSASGGTFSNIYWNSDTVGQASAGSAAVAAASTALDSTQMMQEASFAGFDISGNGGENTVWRIYEGQSSPLLRSLLRPLTITADDASATAGTAYSGGTASYSQTPDGNLLGTLSFAGDSQGASAAGTYTITPQGQYSNQMGYDIVYVDGTLTLTSPPANSGGDTAVESPADNSSTLSLTVADSTQSTQAQEKAPPVHLRGGKVKRNANGLLRFRPNYIRLQ